MKNLLTPAITLVPFYLTYWAGGGDFERTPTLGVVVGCSFLAALFSTAMVNDLKS